MAHIIVIGAGVIGLTCALRLQEALGCAVTVVARDFPAPFETVDRAHINYSSPWAGAHNRWVPPSGDENAREHRMSLASFRRMKDLARSRPDAGITWTRGIEYLEAPSPEYRALTEERARELGMEGFRRLRSDELPEKVVWGCEYDTWCANPMVYCCFLLRRFVCAGGKIVRRELRSPEEAFAVVGVSPASIVVNASGNGFDDPNMFITRGQTCVVSNPCDATVTRQNADGSWSFSVPRNFDGGTVVGGTKEPDNWDAEPSLRVREHLLSAFAATYPSVLGPTGEFHVLADIVGRRPTRHGGLRLETEEVGDKAVVHAYGLGGRGYELSWGVAEEVLQHVRARLEQPKL